jgi:protein SCO1/2
LALLAVGSASAAPLNSRSIYQSNSPWKTQEGKPFALKELRGSPVVAAMIYTTCPASCPFTMADLKKIEKGLSSEAKRQIRFAVFSFDSDNDQPSKLKAFAEKHGVDLNRWTFLHGPASSVREVAALLGIRFKMLEDGTIDHSNVISILNTEGVVIHQQVGLGKKPEESIQSLQESVGAK